jgi:peptidoglycan pentaglycine glycine transferase (the first glycine)
VNVRSRHGPSPLREVDRYSIRVSDESDDPSWDDFVERAPGGDSAQTTCWGRARASIGWRPVRFVVSDNGSVVAGAQMTIRPARFVGNAGFVFKGPLVWPADPSLNKLVFDELLALGSANDVQVLFVQPPRGSDWMSDELLTRGFRPSLEEITYSATVLIDLAPDLDGILAQMKRQTRQNIRTAENRGVAVRLGSATDLPTFYRLGAAHTARLGYARPTDNYYEELWRALAPRGHIALFVAEYENEPVAALLAIPFADTVRHVERAWSGEHGELRPNELLMWEAIKWAKSVGYRFVDPGGIKRYIAEAVLSGQPAPADASQTAQAFKMKFGGRPVLDPVAYDWFYNPVLRRGYRLIPQQWKNSDRTKRIVARMR